MHISLEICKTVQSALTSAEEEREKVVLRNNDQAITKPEARRLDRRDGVRRIAALIYEDLREASFSYSCCINIH